MTKNNKTMNDITAKIAAAITAILMIAFSYAPAYALSYSLNYLDNGDGTLYDEETGCYVDMDTYHAAYGYEYDDETNSYVYRTDYDTYTCSCTACIYWKEGHKIVVPGQESDTTDSSENADQEAISVKVSMTGTEMSDDNQSGTGWNYDKASNTLTLDGFSYEGTGLFTADSADTGSSSEDESTDEGEDSDEDEWEDEESYEDGDEDSDDSDTEGFEDGTAEPVKGVIRSEGDLTLKLNGENHITVTDEASDASYAVNVAGEFKIEGDGVLYVKTATEEKIYGNEPKEEGPNAGNSGNINNITNTNDIDNTQTVNEAPVTQTVDDGDVAVSNNNTVNAPDVSNNISLPGASNTITFNPTIEVRLPENKIERTVLSGMQSRYPEVVKTASATPGVGCGNNAGGDLKIASAETKDGKNESNTAVAENADADNGLAVDRSAPRTADPNTVGLITALIATVIGGAGALIVMIRRRILGRI